MCLRPGFLRDESKPLWREPRGDPLAVRQLEIDIALVNPAGRSCGCKPAQPTTQIDGGGNLMRRPSLGIYPLFSGRE
jgi:hypothetical protein